MLFFAIGPRRGCSQELRSWVPGGFTWVNRPNNSRAGRPPGGLPWGQGPRGPWGAPKWPFWGPGVGPLGAYPPLYQRQIFVKKGPKEDSKTRAWLDFRAFLGGLTPQNGGLGPGGPDPPKWGPRAPFWPPGGPGAPKWPFWGPRAPGAPGGPWGLGFGVKTPILPSVLLGP